MPIEYKITTPPAWDVKSFLECKMPQLQVGDGTNDTKFSTTGTLTQEGSATTFTDLRFPFTSTKLGANAKPDFDTTNVGLLFPQNDNTEIIYIIAQLPHAYKEGSDLRPHIHWQQMNTNAVVWKMQYKWFNRGDIVPAAFTTLTHLNNVIPYSSGNISQVSAFPVLSGVGKTVSSILLIKVYREDNVDAGAGGGDALAFEFDIHYESDALGSETEFIK